MYSLSENSAVPTLAKRFGISLTDLIKSDIHRGLTRKKGHFGYKQENVLYNNFW